MGLDTSRIQAVFLDVDGTVFFKGQAIPGAAAALDYLRAAGYVVRLFSNIDSQSPEEIAADLSAAGLLVRPEEVFTPVRALEEFLFAQGNPRCEFLVSENLRRRLVGYEMPVDSTPDFVVLGDCSACANYDNLNRAFRHLMAGAELLALQAGRFYHRADGLYLDTGGFVRLLEYASGKEARILGKPSPDFFRLALGETGIAPESLLVVGDDLTTDIAGAKGVGAQAVLVRTGKFRLEALRSPPAQPDTVIDSVADLSVLLR